MTECSELAKIASEALKMIERKMSGKPVSKDEKEACDRILLAACFAAEAYDRQEMMEQGVYALQQSFLRALADPLDPNLDHLRQDPEAGVVARSEEAVR